MNTKRVALTAVILFVVMFLVEFLIHDLLLKGAYAQTASVWRPSVEMQSHMGHMMLGYLFYVIFFAVIYAKGYEKNKPGLGQGFRFGILIGLLSAPMNSLIWYSVLPIPASLAVSWLVAGLVKNTILGMTAGLIYRS